MTGGVSEPEDLATWPDRLESACVGTRFVADRVRVLPTCESTQDLAAAAGPGAIVTTGHQSAGRGRLGRRWSEEAGTGVAVSFCVGLAGASTMSLAAGLAAREAVADAWWPARDRVGLKFPNDLVDRLTARKLGGVLVEVRDGEAVIGIGINVGVRAWPADVRGVSLADWAAGPRERPDRLTVILRLVETLDSWLDRPTPEIEEAFRAVHAPTGRRVTLEGERGRHVGRLVDLDPGRALVIERDDGALERLPAATTRILDWRPESAGDSGSFE